TGGLPVPPAYTVDRSVPVVAAVAVNDGAAQRSMVTTLTVTFTGAVTLAGGAATVTRSSDGAVFTPAVATAVVNDRTVATLTFAGPGVEGGSLPDGLYTLRVRSAAVQQAGVGMAANDVEYRFHRLFGDLDADGDADAADLMTFGNPSTNTPYAFGAQSAYHAELDADADGDCDADDKAAFDSRTNTPLTLPNTGMGVIIPCSPVVGLGTSVGLLQPQQTIVVSSVGGGGLTCLLGTTNTLGANTFLAANPQGPLA